MEAVTVKHENVSLRAVNTATCVRGPSGAEMASLFQTHLFPMLERLFQAPEFPLVVRGLRIAVLFFEPPLAKAMLPEVRNCAAIDAEG